MTISISKIIPDDSSLISFFVLFYTNDIVSLDPVKIALSKQLTVFIYQKTPLKQINCNETLINVNPIHYLFIKILKQHSWNYFTIDSYK